MLITGPRLAAIKLEGMIANTVFTVPAYHTFVGLTAINRSTGSETLTIRNASGGFPILPAGFSVIPGAWRGISVPMFMYEVDHDLEIYANDWTDMSVDMLLFLHDMTPWA
jgi:hypothetical protein